MIQNHFTSPHTNSQACLELDDDNLIFHEKSLTTIGENLSKNRFFGGQLLCFRSGFMDQLARESIMQRAEMRGE